MRFIVEVRIEGADLNAPSPVTVGVIERSADTSPVAGLGLLLHEAKDLMQQLQTIVVAEQAVLSVKTASKCRTCMAALGIKDSGRLGDGTRQVPRVWTSLSGAFV